VLSRHCLNQLNAAAMSSFRMGVDMSFDEGGSACCSRVCPVRQYNKDKPDKYRVDFFILSDAKYYFIYHMDVYQGKNDHNCYINKRAAELPTTQKAVVNAFYQTGLDKWDPCGYRHLSTDNRHGCPELCAVNKDFFWIFTTATCGRKRKGWRPDLMDLVKKDTERGEYKLAHDKHNKIVIGQWRDSKVVGFVSSIKSLKIGIRRRQGNKRDKHMCPEVLIHYQQNMCGVDKGDQMRLHGGGFARKAHFKKWHKKEAFLAIVDCMLLNSLIGWNLSSSEYRSNRRELKQHELYTWVAEAMMTYTDPSVNARSPEQVRDATASLCVGTHAHWPKKAPNQSRCVVCELDSNYLKYAAGVMDNAHCCTAPNCQRIAHDVLLASPRKIHDLRAFRGMTCFEILHSNISKSVW